MSRRGTILVTGATGKVGRNVAGQLLDAGHAVRAVTRRPATADLAGAEIFQADLTAPDSLKVAATGCGVAFLLWPYGASRNDQVEVMLELLSQRMRRVVCLSSRGVRDDVVKQHEPNAQFHADVERAIIESGLTWTFLRPGGFAANTLMWADQVRDPGVVRAPFGALSRPLIDERDIARVAVAALTDDVHAGATYVLSGPNSLTQVEQVETIGAVIGRPLRWEEQSIEAARESMLRQGMPPSMVDGALATWARMLTAPETPTTTVQQVTGRRPASFVDWVRAHRGEFV
ncbi:MAG: NAD(P)H-binding protein [Mycobacterium sp.]|nr:NAD(P)H-binding protein [Mycobacterium sp.]